MFLTSKVMTFPRVGGDPYFDNVSLLLHMDGEQDKTVFTDSSKYGNVIYPSNVITDQSVKQFGSASGCFGLGGGAGTSNWLGLAGGDSHRFGGDFTIEAFVRQSARFNYSFIYCSSANSMNAGGVIFYVQQNGYLALFELNTNTLILTANTAVPLNTMSYVAARKLGNAIELGLNGALVGSATYTGAFNPAGNTQYVGGCGAGAGIGYSWPGWIDEVRVTNGVARDIFSVPTAPFPDRK